MPGTSNIAREMGYVPGTASTRYLPWARKGARFTAPAWVDKIIGVQLLRQRTRSLFFSSVSVIPNFFPNLPPLSCSKFPKLKGRPWKKNIARLSWRVSGRWAGRCRAAHLASIRQMSRQVSYGSAGDYPGLCQVPAVMSRIQAEAGHMVLGVSLLIPLSMQSWRHGHFFICVSYWSFSFKTSPSNEYSSQCLQACT